MDRRIEKTRKAIQEAYFRLIMNSKLKKITISEIAKEADIDRKTFYLHYESIDDILKDFTNSKISELKNNLGESNIKTASFTVESFFETLNSIVMDNYDLFKFIATNQKYDFFFGRIKDQLVESIVSTHQKYFQLNDQELEIHAEFFISAIISSYVRWIKNDIPVDIQTLSQTVRAAAFGELNNILINRKMYP